jgi:hypothetical protein
MARNYRLVAGRQEDSCGGFGIQYNRVWPHLPGSGQGWGDGRSVLFTPTVPAVAKQLALTISRLPRVYLLLRAVVKSTQQDRGSGAPFRPPMLQ